MSTFVKESKANTPWTVILEHLDLICARVESGCVEISYDYGTDTATITDTGSLGQQTVIAFSNLNGEQGTGDCKLA